MKLFVKGQIVNTVNDSDSHMISCKEIFLQLFYSSYRQYINKKALSCFNKTKKRGGGLDLAHLPAPVTENLVISATKR